MDRYFEQAIEYLVDMEIAGKAGNRLPAFSDFDAGKYPDKLYRYRSGKKYDFDALEGDYLWIDYPSHFVDPEDARVNLGRIENDDKAKDLKKQIDLAIVNRIWKEYSDALTKLGIEQDNLVNFVASQSDKDISKTEIEKEIQSLTESLNKKEKKDINKKIISPLKSLEEQSEITRSHLYGSNRENIKVCCLTESFDNKTMWENYAGQYSGFVIEYSKPDITFLTEKEIDILTSLFPVSYFKSMPSVDTSPLFLDALNDNSLSSDSRAALVNVLKQALIKSDSYSGEREWRLIRNKDEKGEFSFPYATAVYTGYKIKKTHYSKLKKMCREKQLILFRQLYDEKSALLSYVVDDDCYITDME